MCGGGGGGAGGIVKGISIYRQKEVIREIVNYE